MSTKEGTRLSYALRDAQNVCPQTKEREREKYKSPHIYLLVSEFEVRTVSYGTIFFPFRFIYGASAKRAGHKS